MQLTRASKTLRRSKSELPWSIFVALATQGKFAGEELEKIEEDDDMHMLSAMVRELVERDGIDETAYAVWKAVNAEGHRLFPDACPPESGAGSRMN